MKIIKIPLEHKMFNEEFSGSLENFIYDEFALVYTCLLYTSPSPRD